MRRSLLVPLTLLLALAAAAPALAGGWATTGLSSTPAGVKAGSSWNVDITVLQHGRTPLDGLTPAVIIRSAGTTREFSAKPTGKTGVYRAHVVFPRAGRWTYEVRSGFGGGAQTFPPVQIAPAVAPAPVAAPDDGVAAGWLWGAGAALVLALAVVVADRRRRAPQALAGSPEPAA